MVLDPTFGVELSVIGVPVVVMVTHFLVKKSVVCQANDSVGERPVDKIFVAKNPVGKKLHFYQLGFLVMDCYFVHEIKFPKIKVKS